MRIDIPKEHLLLPVAPRSRRKAASQSRARAQAATAVFSVAMSIGASANLAQAGTVRAAVGSAQLAKHNADVSTFSMHAFEAQHEVRCFSRARARVEQAARLERGWDGENSEAPSPVAHAAAREIISLFERETTGRLVDSEPQVVPRASGGFQFEWRHKDRELLVGFDNGGALEVLEVAPNHEIEFVGTLAQLRESIGWLFGG